MLLAMRSPFPNLLPKTRLHIESTSKMHAATKGVKIVFSIVMSAGARCISSLVFGLISSPSLFIMQLFSASSRYSGKNCASSGVIRVL